MSVADDIERLHALHVQGAMTADEYQRAKVTLLADGIAAEPSNDEPFTWENVATPTPRDPPPTPPREPDVNPLANIGGAALGSWMVGLLVCLLAEAEIVPTAVVVAVGGTIAWAGVSAASATTTRSRGPVGAMLLLLKGLMAVAFVLAFVAVIGLKVATFVNKPEPPSEKPKSYNKALIH